MEVVTENNECVYLFDGIDESHNEKKYGITKRVLSEYASRGQTIKLAQIAGIIAINLPLCKVMFQGIKRPCKVNDDMNGDEKKRVLVLHPRQDFDWPTRSRFDGISGLQENPTPEGMVFTVIVTPNIMKEQYPSVDFWLEHWVWVESDQEDNLLPVDFRLRYDDRIL